MIFETERTVLRPWEESDAEECFRYASDPRVGPAAGWPPHKSVEDSRRVIREVLSASETYAVVLKETGLPVGSVGLHHNDLAPGDDEAELGYWIGVPYWGRGLIPEAAREILRHAFEDLKLARIWCGYYDGNEKSKRVQEKLGFKYQWSTDEVPVPLLGETRKGHVNLMTKEDWVRFICPAAFESERIRFVRVSEVLIKDYLAMINDFENVGRLIGRTNNPVTEEQDTGWVRKKLEKNAPVFSMIEKKTGDFIGNIEIMDPKDGEGELGIAITAKKQNRGFGSEAIPALIIYGMERLGLSRIFLKVYPDNTRAIRVYEKCGFREYRRTGEDVFMEVKNLSGRPTNFPSRSSARQEKGTSI